MKVRTDFVTNSSSSSFCIEIEVESNDTSRFVFETKANEYGANSNLSCSAEEIRDSSDIQSLCELLNSSMKGTGKTKIKAFLSELKDNIDSVEDISSIILRRIWTADGEAASCQIKNDSEFMGLCEKIVSSDKENQEKAVEELKNYLETAEVYAEGGWSDSWPTEFCASKAIPRYKCGSQEKTLVDIAKKAIEERNYGDNDLAVETTVIDMKHKVMEQSADFYIYGKEKDIGKKKAYRSLEFFRNIISQEFSRYEIQENVDISIFIDDYKNPCDKISFVLYEYNIPQVAIAIKTDENARTKTFKEISKVCEYIELPYICLDNKKDTVEKKIVDKIYKVL